MYSTAFKIDDTIYYTPISHRRGSKSFCTKLTDTKDPFYKFANEYIEYMRIENCGAIFCTHPKNEIIPVFDMKGYFIKSLPRNVLYNTDYSGKVVFGFIFNKQGKLLLQKRSQFVNDNKYLWDKSFGGYMNSSDLSIENAAIRELKEELITKNRDAITIQKIIPFQEATPVFGYFNLCKISNFISNRDISSNKNVNISQIVNVFCFILKTPRFITPDKSVVKSTKWVDLQSLKENINNHSEGYSDDLVQLINNNEKFFNELILISDYIRKNINNK